MAQFEIDIELCLKDRRPFKITNTSRRLRRCAMASCLDELEWLSKSKLDINSQAKVSMFLEKDGTEIDDQSFFEKISDHTRFVAKEIPLNYDINTKKISKYPKTEKGFKKIQIGRHSYKKKIGLKISGNLPENYIF